MNNSFEFNTKEEIGGLKESLYLPAVSAIVHNRLDIDSLNPHNPQVAAIMVRNGLMPDQAGTLMLPGDNIGAYDLVDGWMDRAELHILPTEKSAVDSKSREIQQHFGLIVLSDLAKGTIKPIAEVDSPLKAHWNNSYKVIGNCSLRLFGFESPIYDIKEVGDNGEVAANIPKRYF